MARRSSRLIELLHRDSVGLLTTPSELKDDTKTYFSLDAELPGKSPRKVLPRRGRALLTPLVHASSSEQAVSLTEPLIQTNGVLT